MPKEFEFKPLEEQLTTPELQYFDGLDLKESLQDQFENENKRLPEPTSEEDANTVLKLAVEFGKSMEIKMGSKTKACVIDEEMAKKLALLVPGASAQVNSTY
eukprot:8253-Amorphochlora_amoeboformis.AAC.1